MKNILLLTDFSSNSNNALDYALKFFKGGEYHFFILNVQRTSNYTTGELWSATPSSSVYDSIIKNPKDKLAKMVAKFEKEFRNEAYTFDVICDYDTFISAVNQTVKLKSIDLIVMGTNGATGAKEVIFGSNTISVIRNVDRPVLVIPQKYKFSRPTRILFATEMDELFIEKSLIPLTYILSKYNAELEILTIGNEKSTEQISDKKAKIDTYFKGTKHNFYTITDVAADIAIDSFVQINKVDLVAKIINKESFLKRLLSKSSMSELTYKTKVPLLIMHS